jgi:hypothetical protein
MNRAETDAFNRGFLPHYGGWYSRIEYAPGATVGNPDALLLVSGRILPLEVKVATVLKRGGLRVKVRPSQSLWHRKLIDADGMSAFFIRADDGRSWVLPGCFLETIIDGELGPQHDMLKLHELLSVCVKWNDGSSSVSVRDERPFIGGLNANSQ